jgi:pimeloyl-ACP methyl ester carboxylesterase
MAANAKRLDAFIKSRHAYVKGEIERRFGEKDVEVKFYIVAHSMGGILTRYYLRYGGSGLPNEGPLPPVTWEGARHVKSLIMVGTPNAGSLAALQQLIEGFGDIPFAPDYDPVMLGTMPAIYQLLPQTRHRALRRKGEEGGEPLDIYDPELWIKLGWGLAAPDADQTLKVLLPGAGSAAERRRIALVHLRKNLGRAERMWAALNVPAHPPAGLSLNLFGGDAVPTDAVMEVDLDTGNYEVVERSAGDGVVLRSSSLMDERMDGNWTTRLRTPITWDRVFFLFTDHLGMTKDPAFTDNILFMLLEGRKDRELL